MTKELVPSQIVGCWEVVAKSDSTKWVLGRQPSGKFEVRCINCGATRILSQRTIKDKRSRCKFCNPES